MEDVFDTFGNVKTIRTDNGPPFNGDEYKRGGIETYMRLVNKGMCAQSMEGGTWRRSLAATIAAHNEATCGPTRRINVWKAHSKKFDIRAE